jgi:hypothetical protein
VSCAHYEHLSMRFPNTATDRPYSRCARKTSSAGPSPSSPITRDGWRAVCSEPASTAATTWHCWPAIAQSGSRLAWR